MPQYRVTLNEDEVVKLREISTKGKIAAKTVLHARALLLVDKGPHTNDHWTVEQTAKAVGLTDRTINHLKERFVTQGLDAALNRKPQEHPSRPIKFDGEFEAKLTQIACTDPPEGYKRWTVRLLADKMVEMSIVDTVSPMTVQRILKKKEIKPHLSVYWKIQEEISGEFVCRMEDILDVYQRPYSERFPVICMDESPKQLIGEVREPVGTQPGKVRKVDDEYERKGISELFMAIEPLTGHMKVKVTETRTKKDWALFMKDIADHYCNAEKIVLVMDNLNTHTGASFYETFPPEEAHRLLSRFEIHYTPKHGSWLNIAEHGFSIIKRSCIPERIDSIEKLRSQVDTWIEERNKKNIKVNWQFKSSDARIKLKRLYPEIIVEAK